MWVRGSTGRVGGHAAAAGAALGSAGSSRASLSVQGQVSVPLYPPCCGTAEPAPEKGGKTPTELPRDIYWFGWRPMHMNQCYSCGLGTSPSSSSSSMCPGEQPEPPPGASGTQEGHTEGPCPSSCLLPALGSRALPGLWLPLSLTRLPGWVTLWEARTERRSLCCVWIKANPCGPSKAALQSLWRSREAQDGISSRSGPAPGWNHPMDTPRVQQAVPQAAAPSGFYPSAQGCNAPSCALSSLLLSQLPGQGGMWCLGCHGGCGATRPCASAQSCPASLGPRVLLLQGNCGQ